MVIVKKCSLASCAWCGSLLDCPWLLRYFNNSNNNNNNNNNIIIIIIIIIIIVRYLEHPSKSRCSYNNRKVNMNNAPNLNNVPNFPTL